MSVITAESFREQIRHTHALHACMKYTVITFARYTYIGLSSALLVMHGHRLISITYSVIIRTSCMSFHTVIKLYLHTFSVISLML